MKSKFIDRVIRAIKACSSLSEDDEAKVRYVLKVLVFELFVDTTAILIGILLGVLPYITITTMVFGVLRMIAGGAHANTRIECFVLYNFIIWGTIYVSVNATINDALYVIFLVINIIIASLYAPGDTKKIPVLRKSKRRILKIVSLLLVMLFFLVAFQIKSVNSIISNIIVLSVNNTMLLLMPIGYRLCKCKREYKSEKLLLIKECVSMYIEKNKLFVCSLIIVVCLCIANLSTYAASWPFRIFQEEVPKCLLEN